MPAGRPAARRCCPRPGISRCFLIGAIAMRGAGCTYNDLVDHDDRRAGRAHAFAAAALGPVSRRQAWVFLVLQALAGLAVLLQFNRFTSCSASARSSWSRSILS